MENIQETSLCPQWLLGTDDINTTTVSLRQAVARQSSSNGQAFTTCNCAGILKKIQDKPVQLFQSKPNV